MLWVVIGALLSIPSARAYSKRPIRSVRLLLARSRAKASFWLEAVERSKTVGRLTPYRTSPLGSPSSYGEHRDPEEHDGGPNKDGAFGALQGPEVARRLVLEEVMELVLRDATILIGQAHSADLR